MQVLCVKCIVPGYIQCWEGPQLLPRNSRKKVDKFLYLSGFGLLCLRVIILTTEQQNRLEFVQLREKHVITRSADLGLEALSLSGQEPISWSDSLSVAYIATTNGRRKSRQNCMSCQLNSSIICDNRTNCCESYTILTFILKSFIPYAWITTINDYEYTLKFLLI